MNKSNVAYVLAIVCFFGGVIVTNFDWFWAMILLAGATIGAVIGWLLAEKIVEEIEE